MKHKCMKRATQALETSREENKTETRLHSGHPASVQSSKLSEYWAGNIQVGIIAFSAQVNNLRGGSKQGGGYETQCRS